MNDNIKELIVEYNTSILSAIKKMDSLKCKLLIVTNKKKFYSLISIGDIQRAIIKNIPLDSEIKDIIRKEVKIASDSDPFENIKQKMLQFRMEFMPVINADKEIINLPEAFPGLALNKQ